MNPEGVGRILIGVGGIMLAIGVILHFFGGKFGALGRLPGDISIERENFRFYFPITTLLLLNLLIWIAVRIYRFFSK